jgi:hypothetical protein
MLFDHPWLRVLTFQGMPMTFFKLNLGFDCVGMVLRLNASRAAVVTADVT